MNIRLRIGIVLSLAVTLSTGSPLFAADCEKCIQAANSLREQNENKARTTELLGKNQAYLASLSAQQASKFLKLSSNVTQILKRLDEIKKQAEATELEMHKMNCEKCEIRSPS